MFLTKLHTDLTIGQNVEAVNLLSKRNHTIHINVLGFCGKEIGLNRQEFTMEVRTIPAISKINQPFPASNPRPSAPVHLFAQYMMSLAPEESAHIRSNEANDIRALGGACL